MRFTAADDAVYAATGTAVKENGSGGTLLGDGDYYFSSVRVELTEKGYNVFGAANAAPETVTGVDENINQNMVIYAMFAGWQNWEEVATVPWNSSGSMSYEFTAAQINKKPWRVKAVHDIVNYEAVCDIYTDVHINAGSTTVQNLVGTDLSKLCITNNGGLAAELLQYGDGRDNVDQKNPFGDGRNYEVYITNDNSGQHITNPENEAGYFHTRSTHPAGLPESLYDVDLWRDIAWVECTAFERQARATKVGKLVNDVVNGRANITYTITEEDGYIFGNDELIDPMLKIYDSGDNFLLPDQKEITIYDLLPTNMSYDPSYGVHASLLPARGGNDVSATCEIADSNYHGTSRQMLKITLKFNGDKPYTSSAGRFYQGWNVSFTGYWLWKDLNLSNVTKNIAAVLPENGREFIAGDGETYPDDGQSYPSHSQADYRLFGSDIDND